MAKYLLPATERVRVYVDGNPVEVPANFNVIQACEAAGVTVPHYCWHPSLSVPGNCRLCLVKIDGGPRLVAGCYTPVKAEQKITTNDVDVADSRLGMMEFLLANHPLDCPMCDRGGECQLQRYSMDYGVGASRFTPNPKRRHPKPDFDPLIDLERNRCILCTRCTRFCAEVAGDPVMGVFGRGDMCYIGTFGDGPVSNIYSGNVIDICPVGCLTNKPYRFKARPWELRQVTSVCTGCSSGCPVTYWMRAGEVLRTTPPSTRKEQLGKFMLDEDTTDFLCNQGRFGNDYGRHEDRVDSILFNKEGKGHAEAPTWDEVLKFTAATLKVAAAKGRAAVLVSARQTNEEYFAAAHLARVALKTANIDWRVALPDREACDAVSEAMAMADGSLDRLHEYAAVLVVGGSPQRTSPIAGLEIKEAARRGQTKLYIAGSRVESFFAEHAKGVALFDAAHEALFLEWLAKGAGGTKGATPKWLEATGGDAALEALAAAVRGGPRTLLVYDPTAMSGRAAAAIVAGVKALKGALGDALHTLPLMREANGVGAFMAGAQPDRLALGSLKDDAARTAAMETAGGLANLERGLTAPEILAKAAAGEIDALLVVGLGDAFAEHPDAALVASALERVPFVAATELLDGPLLKHASVVLPVANFYEKSGTTLNAEGRVGHLARAEKPQGQARPEFEILAELAARAGAPLPFRTPEQAFAHLRGVAEKVGAATKTVALSSDPRTTNAAFNFVRRGQHDGHALVLRRRAEANGFKATVAAAGVAKGDGLALVWDDHLQGHGHYARRALQADLLTPPPTVEMHPDDVARLGLSARDEAQFDVGGATYRARVVANALVRRGTAYVARNVVGALIARDGDLPRIQPKAVKASPAAPSSAAPPAAKGAK